jgi:hypothetical protein
LTELGHQQAKDLSEAFRSEIGSDDETGLPKPEMSFVSPLARAGQTLGHALGWAFDSKSSEDDWGQGVPAIVVEVRFTS